MTGKVLKPDAVWRWCAAVLLLLAAFQGSALAKLGNAITWEEVSPDGKYVLVMISPHWGSEGRFLSPAESAKRQAIRAACPCSGLYQNDASRTLLWKIDEYEAHGFVFFAPDGQHVVIAGGSLISTSGFRMVFLAADRAPKSQYLFNCVPFVPIKGRLSYKFFEPSKDRFDADKLTSTVWTEMGEIFVFDVRKGTLLDVSSPWHRGALGLLTCLMGAIAAASWWFLRRGRVVAGPRC
jgi:hypothetical protein